MTDLLLKDMPKDMAEYFLKQGFAELFIRGKNKRYSKFKKIAIEVMDDQGKNLPEEVIQHVFHINQNQDGKMLDVLVKNVNKHLLQNGFDIDKLANLGNFLGEAGGALSALSWVNLGLNVANLCVTAAGFVVINKKLNTVISELNDVKAKLDKITAAEEIKTMDQFERVISSYGMMLDREKVGRPLSEDELAQMVDDMYHTLNTMQKLFTSGLFDNKAALLDAIYALTPMYAQTIIRFDRVYYFAHKDVLKNDYRFHNNHEKWLNLFDAIYSDQFLDCIQDHCVLDKRMNNREASQAVALSFYTIAEAKQDVLDNQKLLLFCDSSEEYNEIVRGIDEYSKAKFEEELSAADELSPEELKTLLSGVYEQYELQRTMPA